MTGKLGKPGWVLVLLAGAFVVPYTLCNPELRSTVAKALAGGGEAAGKSASIPTDRAAVPDTSATGAPVPPQAPACDIATAISFDVSPQWVTGTWPRATAVPDAIHSGLRVPLVTGVMPDDLVGTLTYYFDEQQRLQRITFTGNTADPRRLVTIITGQYRLKPQSTLDAGLYQSKWNSRVISSLHIRRAPLAKRGAYEVQLDLNRADVAAGTAGIPRPLLGF
jgi:uncharacterized protein DUF6690